MKELVVGPKASLYLDTYRMTGNIPGQGVTMWYNNDYYILREDQWQYVKEGQLLKKPELYFPDAVPLHKVIKNTKRADIQMVQWVEQFNNRPWEH